MIHKNKRVHEKKIISLFNFIRKPAGVNENLQFSSLTMDPAVILAAVTFNSKSKMKNCKYERSYPFSCHSCVWVFCVVAHVEHNVRMRNVLVKRSDSNARIKLEVNKSEITSQVIMRGWGKLKGSLKVEIQKDRSPLIPSMALSASTF